METTVLISLSGQQFDELISSSLRKALQHQTPQVNDHNEDTLLDTKEAAVLINYKETSVYGLVKRKKIPFIKVEGKLLFSKKKLLEWVARGEQSNF
jgi:excisionase family DNA binding protein